MPRTWLGGAAAAVIAVSLVAALTRVPHLFTVAHDALTGPTYSLSQADIEPLGVSASVDAIGAAARVIPRDATWSVVGGDKYDVWWVYRVWLAPRPFVPDYTTAAWVVVNGGPEPTDLPHGEKIPLTPDVYVVRVGP